MWFKFIWFKVINDLFKVEVICIEVFKIKFKYKFKFKFDDDFRCRDYLLFFSIYLLVFWWIFFDNLCDCFKFLNIKIFD